jgi:predicted amidohydrolase YtcJ
MKPIADLILQNGRITTLDPRHPSASEAVIVGDKIVGVDNAAEFERGPQTKVVDLKGRRVIPGLYESHLHVIRGGLNYNMELRWEGVPSLSLALQMLREQAARTPAPQWVRVVGGWTEFQFVERRMPTLEEINAAAPDTPVFGWLSKVNTSSIATVRKRLSVRRLSGACWKWAYPLEPALTPRVSPAITLLFPSIG